jgi:hypothetical protein
MLMDYTKRVYNRDEAVKVIVLARLTLRKKKNKKTPALLSLFSGTPYTGT